MSAAILDKINSLPNHLQDDIEHYVDFLIQKQAFEAIRLGSEEKKELDQRLNEYYQNPNNVLSISQLKEKMNAKYGI